MAKDPALLWYFNDWMGGTATLSRHLKGCYIDLLCVQFNNGPLSLDEIKTVLGSDFGSSWPTLQKKFKSENGLFFNERLQTEKDKRSKFTTSRRVNASSSKLAQATDEHMEDVNRNEISNKLPIWLNQKAWTAWEQHRKEKGKKLTPTSIRLQLKFLEEYKQDHAQIIKNSITNGWTGLFPLKGETVRKPNKYVEPNYDKETNERRNLLAEQFKRI